MNGVSLSLEGRRVVALLTGTGGGNTTITIYNNTIHTFNIKQYKNVECMVHVCMIFKSNGNNPKRNILGANTVKDSQI
jgi:phosphotransferase system IIA component